jgi:ribosome-associated protein
MDGLLPEINQVRALCRLLEEHKGGEVVALDLRSLHSWTDFFIIATVSSNTHLQGMLRHIKEFAAEQGLAILRGQRKDSTDGWNIIDMGTAVIHLMTAPTREFYELEQLWLPAERIFP